MAVSCDANEVDKMTILGILDERLLTATADSWLSVMQRIDAPARSGAKVTKAMAMARNSSSPMQRLLRRNADATSLCESVGEPAARRWAVGADSTHGRVGLEDDAGRERTL